MGRGIPEDSLEEGVTICDRLDQWFRMAMPGPQLSVLRHKFTLHTGNV